MVPASELRVLVGVYGLTEANKKLLKFGADTKALASSDPTVRLGVDIDDQGFADFALLKRVAEDSATTMLKAEVDDFGFEQGGIKKAIFEDPATTTLRAEIEDLGFEEAALKKHIFEDPVTTHLHAEVSGFETAIAQLDAVRTIAATPITQEVKLQIDKSSLAALGAEDATAKTASGGGGGGSGGGGGGHFHLGWSPWGGFNLRHRSGSTGGGDVGFPRNVLWGDKLFPRFGTVGSFAGFGMEHMGLTAGGLAGSAATGLLGGGSLLAGGALSKMAVGAGSDALVSSTTIAAAGKLSEKYKALQEQVALYGSNSKQAAKAGAELKLTMQQIGPAAKSELHLAKQASSLGSFWHEQTQEAQESSAHVLGQVLTLAHEYVPLVGKAAATNLAIINKDLKPLFSWLEGPEGTGIFEHLEEEFAQQLPTSIHALSQGIEFLLKTMNVASEYTGGLTESLDHFFTKWNSPQFFSQWEVEIGRLIADFRMWSTFVKVLGHDLITLFSADAGSAKAIVTELTGMLEKLGEWEESTHGQEDIHNIFSVHKEEILELLRVLPPLIEGFGSIYMTIAPPLVKSVTAIAGVFASLLNTIDELGPVARDALGGVLIAWKLGVLKGPLAALGKQLWAPFEALLAKDPLIGAFFDTQVSETEALTGETEGLTTAVDDLTASYGAMAAAGADAQMSLFAETTAAESAAAGAGQTSLFPMGAGLAPKAAETGAATGAEEAAVAGTGGGLLAGVGAKASGLLGKVASSGFAKAGAVAAGYFVTEFGAKLIAPEALEGQNLEQALLHGFNTKGVAQTEARALADARPRARRKQDLGRLKSGYVVELEQIKTLLRRGSEETAKAFAQGSPEWRAAAADNMHAAIEAIETGEHDGFITVEKGNKEIAALMKQAHIVNDPFGIAHSFVTSWEKAGGANKKGIGIAVSQLEQLPRKMAPIAIAMELTQVRHAEQTGHLVKGSYARLKSAIVTELGVAAVKGGEQAKVLGVNVVGPFGEMNSLVREALEDIGGNTNQVLKALSAAVLPEFHLKSGEHLVKTSAPDKAAIKAYGEGHQQGGFTVPGNSAGDRHPYMLPHESFIMNQRATAAHGLQNGGMSPVMLESKERVFLPHEVAAMGAHNLAAMNAGVPRFQKGGQLGAEPQLEGPRGGLLTLGDAAIHMAYKAAQKDIAKHTPKAGNGGAGPISLSGGLVATPLQFAEYMIQVGFPKTVKVISEGLGTIMSESSFKVDNAQGAGGHIGPWAESPAFGSVKVREDPLGSTEAAFREWLSDGHSFWQAWGQWESAQSGLSGGGAGAYGPQFRSVAEEALGARGGRQQRRTGTAAASAHHHGLQGGGLVNLDPRAVAHHPGAHLTPEQQQAHLAWKWGKHLAAGGLVGEEEERRGVPNSTAATAAKKKQGEAKKKQGELEGRQTPTEVTQWAMHHLNQSQPWDSESPGEWCGDFLADDFRSHGMAVPSGYALAENWGRYGTPLGRGHMQAGAVIDYDGQHVAMAISSSEMIQGNDIHGVVGTSEIVSSVGGSPITAVRWPPYSKGHGAGAGSAPVEKVPGTFKGAHTKTLSTPGIPKSLHGITVQLHRWHGELQTYEHAAHLATGRPKLQHALQANVTRIQKYLRELERARHALRKATAKKNYSNHLSKQLGKITGEEKNIELAERAYEVAGQYAEQVVGLEPTEPTLQQAPEQAQGESEAVYTAKARQVEEANHATELGYLHSYEGFVEGRERPAYEKVLGTEADWRNMILGAESKATGMEANWEGQIHSDDVMIAGIPRHFENTKDRVDKWRKKNPKAKHLPRILGREWQDARYEMTLLPELRFKDKELRKNLGEARQAFYPGFKEALQPPQPPLPGSGTFEQSMQEVQGIHWPGEHEHLSAAGLAPPRHAGSFGGAIWDTQTAIEELGLKVTQAQGSIGTVAGGGPGVESLGVESSITAAESERTALLEELLTQAHQREAINSSLGSALSQFDASYPTGSPYMGAFAAGGVALVGERGPELAHFPSGTRIHSASDTERMVGAPETHVHVNGDIVQKPGDTRDPVEVWMRDPRNQKLVRQVIGTTPKPLSTSGAGRAFR